MPCTTSTPFPLRLTFSRSASLSRAEEEEVVAVVEDEAVEVPRGEEVEATKDVVAAEATVVGVVVATEVVAVATMPPSTTPWAA
jgi:NOL1/NOP2/fmu family ribosome biogenesis protein